MKPNLLGGTFEESITSRGEEILAVLYEWHRSVCECECLRVYVGLFAAAAGERIDDSE